MTNDSTAQILDDDDRIAASLPDEEPPRRHNLTPHWRLTMMGDMTNPTTDPFAAYLLDVPAEPETCPNGRPHIGGMDASRYKYDMDDAEWFGGPDDREW